MVMKHEKMPNTVHDAPDNGDVEYKPTRINVPGVVFFSLLHYF